MTATCILGVDIGVTGGIAILTAGGELIAVAGLMRKGGAI